VRAAAGDGAADERVRGLLASGDVARAATETLRSYGPEVLGYLDGSLRSRHDADEVFGATCERIWKALTGFEWRCTLRTWVYTVARHELWRFLKGERRRNLGRVSPAELDGVVVAVRTETDSAFRTEKRNKLQMLRDELSVEDRELLILRVDRALSWEDIALASLLKSDEPSAEEIHREAARLRKRFQLVRQRLAERARKEGLLP
jgi:RNA polymerase sigma-70 factor, ECF subfamily